jgi:hypothetical protein
VVIKGLVPGIYYDWYVRAIIVFVHHMLKHVSYRTRYQQQIFRVPYADGVSMRSPQLAWDYYESERQAGHVCALTRPTSEPRVEAVAQPGIPQTSPFPAEANIFVIFRGKVPGIHYGWLVPFYFTIYLFLISVY